MSYCIKEAYEGDYIAVEALVESLRPRISKMAFYYGRCSGEDPEDLLQEAWIGLLEALPKLDLQIGVPEQHLIARARWRLLDAIKRSRVRRCSQLEDDNASLLISGFSEESVESIYVSEFYNQLKPTQQQILKFLLAGFTWRETGDAIGCASANVAYHVRNIRKMYEEWSDNCLA